MSALKISSGLWLSVFALILMPLQSVAQDNPEDEAMGVRLTRFLSDMEGGWDGAGTVQLLQNDGTIREHRFRIDLDMDDEWEDDTWHARTSTRYDNGYQETQDSWFSVRGNNLFAGDQFNKEPILVEEITSTRLKYSFDRVVYPARLEFSFTLDRLDTRTLRVYSVVRRNGVKIEERVWTARR